MKKLVQLMILTGAAMALIACGTDDDGTDGTTDGHDGHFMGGLYTMQITEAKDNCFDGALEELFKDGDGNLNALTNQVELPMSTDLPKAGTIKLQDPFADMDVTWEADGDNMKIAEATQTAVSLGTQFDGCTADMKVSATVTTGDTVTVAANLEITKLNDDEDCPTIDNPGCAVTLTMTGTK